eukprot:12860840-Prorocentrum_lima.AAC.1
MCTVRQRVVGSGCGLFWVLAITVRSVGNLGSVPFVQASSGEDLGCGALCCGVSFGNYVGVFRLVCTWVRSQAHAVAQRWVKPQSYSQ